MNIHLSIDDFFQPFLELEEQGCRSVFEQRDFALLRSLHERYGAVFSCYCFLEDAKTGASLFDASDAYREEFQANGDWLRFGFHDRNKTVNYGSSKFHTAVTCDDYGQAKADYEAVIGELVRITGGGRCIDRVPRIHYYSGTADDCRAWKDAAYGITGLLSAEDDRLCYYHTEEQRQKLIRDGVLREKELGLIFFRTDLRLERVSGLSEALDRCREAAETAVETVSGTASEAAAETAETLLKAAENDRFLIIFTHEPYLRDPAVADRLFRCGEYAKKHRMTFAYPADILDKTE